MQFSVLAVFVIAIAAVAVSAGSVCLLQNTCILDLAPTVVQCASAAAQGVDNIITDAGCIIAALQDISNMDQDYNPWIQARNIMVPLKLDSGGPYEEQAGSVTTYNATIMLKRPFVELQRFVPRPGRVSRELLRAGRRPGTSGSRIAGLSKIKKEKF
ncbi:hypothetical protein C8R45DRAFT_945507 [Mycena sanguinolenta]|nr:hypothetical protein C8R45DRAFT_945507 [Mycena sanguinolenta]